MPEVFLPSTLTLIGSKTFALCPNLEDVYINCTTPPQTGTMVFLRLTRMGRMYKLYVSAGSKQAYADAGYYNYFFEIIEE